MENIKRHGVLIGGVIAAIAVGAFVFFLASPMSRPLWSVTGASEDAQKAYEYAPDPNSTLIKFTPGVNRWYVSEPLHFSFRIPDGFDAPDGKIQGSDAYEVLLSNGRGNELEIEAVHIAQGADAPLTKEIIQSQIPEEHLSNIKDATLIDGTHAIMFETDSAAWGADGVALWFIKDEYLYTATAEKKDAELLELVAKTLRFGVPVPPTPK
jgi:hypothetical protein